MASSLITCSRGDKLSISPLTEADISRVHAIELKVQTSPWSEQQFISCIEAGKHCYGVYTSSSELIAYIILSEIAGDAELLMLAVDPAWQRQGIAEQLLAFGLDLVKASSETVFLEVRQSNRSALALYEQAGFNEVGVRRRYYPAPNNQREDALIYAKSVQ